MFAALAACLYEVWSPNGVMSHVTTTVVSVTKVFATTVVSVVLLLFLTHPIFTATTVIVAVTTRC